MRRPRTRSSPSPSPSGAASIRRRVRCSPTLSSCTATAKRMSAARCTTPPCRRRERGQERTMDDIERLRDLIGSAHRIVAFTGAGISTESGIPDFRSPGGIWTRYKPIYFDDFMSSEEMRRESWRRKFATDEVMLTAEPNAGHRALAKLVELGRMSAVITQNVDGLHQRSGIPDAKVIELHGNATYAACLDCGHRCELEPIKKAFLGSGKLPLCAKCDGIVKTATISFGQAMPGIAMARAQDETINC